MMKDCPLSAGSTGAAGPELSVIVGAQAAAISAITIASKLKENFVFMGSLFLLE
jgi:3-hydroxyisobutyrate dehydrogenase-like beta-hydroxyacid dehydrogenase